MIMVRNEWMIGIYRNLLFNWTEQMAFNPNCEQYFPSFSKTVEEENKFVICFDNRIEAAIFNLLNEHEMQTFDHQSNANIQRIRIFQIAKFLHKRGRIGKRHLYQISKLQRQCLLNRIKQFQYIIKSKPWLKQDQFVRWWQQTVRIPLEQFWLLMQSQKVKHEILLFVYQCMHFMECKMPQEVTQSSYFQSINKKYHSSLSTTNQTQLISKIQNQTAISSKQSIRQMLDHFALKKSIFLNPNYQFLRDKIEQFRRSLELILFTNHLYKLEYFGSIKNRTALIDSFDLDLTIIALGQRNFNKSLTLKENDYQVLRKFQYKLERQSHRWLRMCYIDKDRAPVTFMKITIDTESFEQIFNIPNLTKLDITIGNQSALINGSIISNIVSQPQILTFCIVVKSWAKRHSIINATTPMAGLSAYGVVLMSIYFLIVTNQIQIQFQNQINYNSVRLIYCCLGKIEQNFSKFLQFYGQNGKFHEQKQIVCLLKDCSKLRSKYRQDIIINMYDFVDDSNPGRLNIEYKQQFFASFDRSLQIMESQNMVQIRMLFQLQ